LAPGTKNGYRADKAKIKKTSRWQAGNGSYAKKNDDAAERHLGHK